MSQKIQIIQLKVEKDKFTEQLTKNESLYNYVKDADVNIVTACEVTCEHVGSLGIITRERIWTFCSTIDVSTLFVGQED